MEEALDLVGRGIVREPAARVGAIHVDQLNGVWPIVVDWIEAGLVYSVIHEFTSEDVYHQLRAQEALLLVVELGNKVVAAAVVRLGVGADGERFVALVCAGGEELEQWLGEMVAAVRNIAASFGASECIVCGRPGWARKLRRYGLRQSAVVMVDRAGVH